MMLKNILMFLIFNVYVIAQQISFENEPQIFAAGIISTEISEVKITFSKDGKLALWGAVGRANGIGGLDIWQSLKTDKGWSIPSPASFNSPDNDFDPCFSAAGDGIYFFSNRPGGFGGDDFYYAAFDTITRTFGEPANMGSQFNTSGDEWGPCESTDGKKFIFCTDGLGGKGQHDIFICEKKANGWSNPKNLDILNSAEDDFDPLLLHDNKTIIFTRKFSDDEACLFISYLNENGYSEAVRLNETINIQGTWNFGSCLNNSEKNYLYYSTHIKDNNIGRLDIYRIGYNLNTSGQ